MTYITRLKTLTVLPTGEPLFSENATELEIISDPDGRHSVGFEYLQITQPAAIETGAGLTLTPEDWPALRDAIQHMLQEIRCHRTPQPPTVPTSPPDSDNWPLT